MSIGRLFANLRPGEKILLGFFAYTTVASLAFQLSFRERAVLLGLNLVVGAAVIALSKTANQNATLAVLRDWLPAALILVAYRESGLFITPDPTHRLDYLFIRLDRWILQSRVVLAGLHAFAPWLQYYLEIAYLLCYPVVPLGIGSLYWARARQERRRGGKFPRGENCIAFYWTAVLSAVLASYVLFPFFPLTPPRNLFQDLPGPAVPPLLRNLNLWLLGQYSVQACLFPSGHVAATTAAALAVRKFQPCAGIIFIILAISIAIATVYGRYHYAVDALAGAIVGIAGFLVAKGVNERQCSVGGN